LRRIGAFHVVAVCRGAGRSWLGNGRLLGWTHSAGAVVTLFFDIVVFRQRGDHSSSSRDLADAVKDDFRLAIVELHRAVDFNVAAFQTAHVAHVFQVVGEDHDRERAGHLIFAKIKEVDSFAAYGNAMYFAGHTLGLTDVLAGSLDGEAVGDGESGIHTEDREQ